jgi:hypothetical protein
MIRERKSPRNAIHGNAIAAHGQRQPATVEFFWRAEMEGIPRRRAVLEFRVGAGFTSRPVWIRVFGAVTNLRRGVKTANTQGHAGGVVNRPLLQVLDEK